MHDPSQSTIKVLTYSSEGENLTRCNFPGPDQEVLAYTCMQSHVFAELLTSAVSCCAMQVHHVFRVLVVAVGLQDSTSAGEGGERKRERGRGVREREMGRSSVNLTIARTGTLRVH